MAPLCPTLRPGAPVPPRLPQAHAQTIVATRILSRMQRWAAKIGARGRETPASLQFMSRAIV